MLVIHNPDGSISQCIVQAEGTLEALSKKYDAAGIGHIMYDGTADIYTCYVKDGEVIPRPEIEVTGELRDVVADGEDALHLTVNVTPYKATVIYEDKPIHVEESETADLVFSIAVPGSYKIVLEAAFPYLSKTVLIEAVNED